jgi:hypothetical protein
MMRGILFGVAATLAAGGAAAEEHGHGHGVEKVTIVDGANSAAVTPGRELSVRDGRLSFDGSGALRTAPQGTQQVSGTVDVGGTVGISPAANTVKIDPQNAGRTIVVYTLADPGGTAVPASGITQFLDVSPYARIRVAAGNVCTSSGKVTVDVRGNDGIGWIVDDYQLDPCEIRDKVYDLPGAHVSVAVWNSTGTANQVFVQVFGR